MIHRLHTSTVESNYQEVVSLDGVDFILRFLWNTRVARWFMTVRDSSGADIITAFKLVTNAPFAPHIVDDRIPAGRLWTIDPTGSETDPGLRDLGRRVLLMYVDEMSSS